MTFRARDLTLRTLQIVLGAAILLTAAAINRSPFVFYDTSHYLQFGRSILTHLSLIDPVAPAGPTEVNTPPAGSAASAAPATSETKDEHASLSYAGGRSPYYSVFVFAGAKLGGFWAIAFVQALIAAWMLWLAVQAFAPAPYRNAKSYFLLTAVLTVFSPLSFYVSMAMPDVLAGLALLGTTLIVFGRDRLSRTELIGVVLVTAGCAATHATTPVLCLLALGGFALIAFALLGKASFRYASNLLPGVVPVVLALAASSAFSLATRVALGEAPKSPPYIMARLLADGPGREYLREACHPEPRYVLCKFEDRKFRTQDDFLWSGKPEIGVFSLTDYSTRLALQAEEMRFAWGAITSYPLWQMEVSAGHWLGQLTRFGLSEFSTAALSWNEMAFEDTVPELGPGYKASLAYQGKLPRILFEWVQWIGLVSSLALLAYWISRPQTWAPPLDSSTPALSTWTFWIVAAGGLLIVLIGNAALCGALSGVNDRYQARLIWLVPLFAALVAARMRAAQSSPTREKDSGEDPAAGLVLRRADEQA
jgi:hypothetical protein